MTPIEVHRATLEEYATRRGFKLADVLAWVRSEGCKIIGEEEGAKNESAN